MTEDGDTSSSGVSQAFQTANIPKRKRSPRPFSLRLTFEERARLEEEAGGMPLGAYIRSKLFAERMADRPLTRTRYPAKDEQALANILGELGRSRIANNLNQLAKAVHTGSLIVGPETDTALRDACAEVLWLRTTLMQGLGLRE